MNPDMMGGDGMMGGAMAGMMGWSIVFMILIPLLLIALVAVLVIWAMRAGREAPRGELPEAPLAILRRRYARGDIGAEEYERIRGSLSTS
ncbi:MAG: SHOCT domain-containing protein [Candidatus Limnocylindria bacterium]